MRVNLSKFFHLNNHPYVCTYYFCFYNHVFIFFPLYSFASTIVIIYNVLLTICLIAYAGKTLLLKYGDCFRTTMGKFVQSESPNLMTPQDALRGLSKVSDLPPVPRSLGDIRQHQHRKRDFQQNLKLCMQPYGLPGKTYMAQPNALSNQGVKCWGRKH